MFGLGLESNRPLAGLSWDSTPGQVDVRVRFGNWPAEIRGRTTPTLPPSHVSTLTDAAGVPLARGWDLSDGSRHVVANSGAEALVDPAGQTVWVSPARGQDLDAWVLGPVLSLVLRRRGVVCLHASAVLMAGGAVAFAGWQGAGKSTLASICAMRGCPVVTDDLAALDVPARPAPIRVHPGGAYVRSRSGIVEVARAQMTSPIDLKPSPSGRYWDLDGRKPHVLASESVPLRAVYFLDRRRAARADAEPAEPLRGPNAVAALAADTWAARWLSGTERAAELQALRRLVNEVPILRIRRPADVDAWLALADKIMKREDAPRG